jgi:hypothetical protein
LGAYRRALWLAPALAAVGLGCVSGPAAATVASVPSTPPRVEDSSLSTLSLIDQRLRRAWPDKPDGPAWFTGGGYQLYARAQGEFVAIRAPTAGPVDDVVISGRFRKVGGPPGGGYGVIVRDRRAGLGDGIDQNGQFVVAAVGDRGDVGVWRRDGTKWIDLVPWTASPTVRSGGSPNDLQVEVLGDRLHFDVNGVRVADIGIKLTSGRVGIFAGGDLNQVLIDRLIVQPLPSARQTDLSAKEEDVRDARATIARLAAQTKQMGAASEQDVERWQREAAGVLSVVHQLERDLSTDYTGSRQEVAGSQRVARLVAEMERDVVAILDLYRDGFDSPRSPINNHSSLETAAARLESAGHTAEQIVVELRALRDNGAANGR